VVGRDLPERGPLRRTGPAPPTDRGPRVRAGELPGEPDEVPEQALAALDRAMLDAGLARLPEEQRWCILLMDVAGYTARETAQILGCPRSTVLARLHRGRRWLARLLTGCRAEDGVEDRGGRGRLRCW
jgi:RNA polymerase sigma factor (sigma-70 family)